MPTSTSTGIFRTNRSARRHPLTRGGATADSVLGAVGAVTSSPRGSACVADSGRGRPPACCSPRRPTLAAHGRRSWIPPGAPRGGTGTLHEGVSSRDSARRRSRPASTRRTRRWAQQCSRRRQTPGACAQRVLNYRHALHVAPLLGSPGSGEVGVPVEALSGRELGTALATARSENRAATARAHAQTEAVGLRTTTVVRLEGPLAHEVLQGRGASPRVGHALVLQVHVAAERSTHGPGVQAHGHAETARNGCMTLRRRAASSQTGSP